MHITALFIQPLAALLTATLGRRRRLFSRHQDRRWERKISGPTSLLYVAAAAGFCKIAMASEQEAFSHPEAYLEKSFIASGIAKSVRDRLPQTPPSKPAARRIKFTIEQTRVYPSGKQEVIQFHDDLTFLGDGLIRINSQRPDMKFAHYHLSYMGLLDLRSEMLSYNKPKRGIVKTAVIGIPRFDLFPPTEGKKATLSYQGKVFALPADPVVTRECVSTGTRDASAIASNLAGKVVDFKCDVLIQGQKWQTNGYVYLQAYGLYLTVSEDVVQRKSSYLRQSMNVFKNFEIVQ